MATIESNTTQAERERELLQKLTDGSMDVADIDIQYAEYSDDEEKIYFTEKQLIQHLFRLEETNLFDVNQLGNDEQQLDEVIKLSQENLI